MTCDAAGQRDEDQVVQREYEDYAEGGKDGHARDGELEVAHVCVQCVCLLNLESQVLCEDCTEDYYGGCNWNES